MSTTEITSKIEALQELEALIEEAKAEADSLRDEIKAEMLKRDTEELTAGQYIAQFASTDCPFRMSGAGSSVEAVWFWG